MSFLVAVLPRDEAQKLEREGTHHEEGNAEMGKGEKMEMRKTKRGGRVLLNFYFGDAVAFIYKSGEFLCVSGT